MSLTPFAFRRIARVGAVTLAVCHVAWAQTPTSLPQTVQVNGRGMRIRTAGFEHRKTGTPAVILEAGLGSTIESWQPVFEDISRLAPVIAYDRSGIGKSEFDNVPPTLAHVAETLHALLQSASIQGPYVLVGHSWGVAFVRTFVDRYPTEISGAVFLEATDFERTPEETAAELPPGTDVEDNAPRLPEGPPGFRAEVQQLLAEGATYFATLRATKLSPSLPISVVMGGAVPRDLPTASAVQMKAFKRLQLKHQAAWAFASQRGLVLMSSSAGHQVMSDEPSLVVQAIRHVLDAAREKP